MIRTSDKEKLPKGFSYPLGAEKISDALGDFPMKEATELRFRWRDEYWKSKWQQRIDELDEITLVDAQYQSRNDELWIFIYAVPSEFNKQARETLLNGQLQELSNQLQTRKNEKSYFHHKINFNLAEHAS